VRHLGARRKRGLEQGGDEETAIGQFHGPRFPQSSACADPQTGGLKLLFVLFIHAVIAVVLLGVIFAPTNRMKERPRQNLQPLVTRAFGTAIPTVRQGARKRRNDVVRRSGIVLGRVGIGDLQNIARIPSRVYWKPLQVPTNGQFCERANSIPRNIPLKLLYGLPGEAKSPSRRAQSFFASGPSREGVGSPRNSTGTFSFVAAS